MNSPLHVHFHNKGLARFRQVLDTIRPNGISSGLSTSGPRSWQNNSSTQSQACDINIRDHLGRTVLHLASTSLEPYALEFVRSLLQHWSLNVNAQDSESHWTALHRALWAGNLPAALLLLQHPEIDTGVKDYDGYTAFDVFNSTIEGTLPTPGPYDLFVWGCNRNATLGLGDIGDRVYPEQIDMESHVVERLSALESSQFYPLRFKDVYMSRLHTVAVTMEKSSNVRACGFGNGGRLGQGPSQHTQYRFTPLSHISHISVRSAALGQDHTLLVTTSGDVYSWGLNRFHQLGYVVEAKTHSMDDVVQSTAKKVSGPLKKIVIEGVAASKIASACFSKEDVYTWGTNRGQLGYASAAQPLQILPRKVTAVMHQPIGLAMTDSALCVLLVTKDVLCFQADSHFRISFSAQVFPSSIEPYRPPQVTSKYASILKIVNSEDSFAALTNLGDVFMWSISEPEASSNGHILSSPKPQRVWVARAQMHAAKDVSLGADGSIIICTESGHVFVRTRSIKQQTNISNVTKAFRFQRVPFLNRVVKVVASTSGAYAALRADATVNHVTVHGATLSDSLGKLLPFLSCRNGDQAATSSVARVSDDNAGDNFEEDEDINADITFVHCACAILLQHEGRDDIVSLCAELIGAHGSDVMSLGGNGDINVSTSGLNLPAHSFMFLARSAAMRDLIERRIDRISDGDIWVKFTAAAPILGGGIEVHGCSPLAVILLLQYLYTDKIAAIGDRRVEIATRSACSSLGVWLPTIKLQLQRLSRILGLQALDDALDTVSKRNPRPTLDGDMTNHFQVLQAQWPRDLSPSYDTLLVLKERSVGCHSAVLRARSPMFASLFGDPAWTAHRWREGVISIDLKHLDWRAMKYVLQHMCCGGEEEMFSDFNSLTTIESLIDHSFHVMAAANELLLDKLVLICSRIISRHISPANVCYVLAEATFLHVNDLMHALHEYIAVNLEYLLERGLLRDMTEELLGNLSSFIQAQQLKKMPIPRSNSLTNMATSKWAEWLALQDIPQPSLRKRPSIQKSPSKSSMGISGLSSKAAAPHGSPVIVSPTQLGPASGISRSQASPDLRSTFPGSPNLIPWKGKGANLSVDKTDMLSIIAEAESSKRATPPKARVVGFQVDEPSKLSIPSNWAPKIPQRDRKKSLQESNLATTVSSLSSNKTLSMAPPKPPWKTLPRTSTSYHQISGPSGITRSLNAQADSSLKHPHVADLTSNTDNDLATCDLGPMITSTKTPPGDLVARRRLPNDPWATNTTIPQNFNETSYGASFVAIQEQQREQIQGDKKPKKSLLEIQQEEEAKRVEADFERWWAMEEEKLKVEQDSIMGATVASSSTMSLANRHSVSQRAGFSKGRSRSRKSTKIDARLQDSTAITGPVSMTSPPMGPSKVGTKSRKIHV